jgi:hypothetical protein
MVTVLSSTRADDAGAEAGLGKGPASASSYAWPAEAGPEPKEEEWAGATDLGTVEVQPASTFWWLSPIHLSCAQRALGAWVRITCTPPHPESGEDTLLGAVWPLSGDAAKAKATFSPASALPRYKSPPSNVVDDLTRKMGASVTITFPTTPGSALLLRVDRIGWDDGYDGSNVFTLPGMLVDVSWALGEKAPTILYR